MFLKPKFTKIPNSNIKFLVIFCAIWIESLRLHLDWTKFKQNLKIIKILPKFQENKKMPWKCPQIQKSTNNDCIFVIVDDQLTFRLWKAISCKSQKKCKILYYPSPSYYKLLHPTPLPHIIWYIIVLCELYESKLSQKDYSL